MPCNEYTIEKFEADFGFKILLTNAEIPTQARIEPSEIIVKTIQRNMAIAMRSATEKAKSENLVAPVLSEIEAIMPGAISVFSGTKLACSDPRLTGFVDFAISAEPNRLVLTSPICTIVEAKNDDLYLAYGQLSSELLAGKIRNQEDGKKILPFGIATNGIEWQFAEITDEAILIYTKLFNISDLGALIGTIAGLINLRLAKLI